MIIRWGLLFVCLFSLLWCSGYDKIDTPRGGFHPSWDEEERSEEWEEEAKAAEEEREIRSIIGDYSDDDYEIPQ